MDDIELIKSKINIVDLISEYLPLKKAGINFKANCPFHGEHTPSFMVSPERQIWHCFGCDKGGDIYKFLMEKEGLEFKDALEILAQKAGVTLKKSTEKVNTNDKLYEINQKAAQFYHYLLTQHALGKTALDYLKKRGLSDETIEQFNLGYAPDSWEDLTRFLKKRGFSNQNLIESGLAVPSKRGCYDRFRGRIIFPLVDIRNRTIGFSGRILGQGEPKYINTPQTPIFDKGKFLFGLNLAKGEIKQKDSAILVEGEMDMLMSFQSGVKNIVASKGTALTENQIEVLKKYAQTILICFDTDLAGDSASRRGIEMADQALLNIKVIEVPGAKDPAELCLQDIKLWTKSVDQAIPIYDYYLDSCTKRFDLKQASSKRAIFAELIPIWQKITDQMTREHYIQKLAALLQVKDDLIRKEMQKPISPQVAPMTQNRSSSLSSSRVETKTIPSDRPTPSDRRKLLEEYLLSLILHLPKDHTYIPNFPETIFTQEDLRQAYVLLVLFLDSISFKGKAFKITDFVKTIPEDLVSVIDRLYLLQIDEKLEEKKNWQKEVEVVVAELKKMLLKTSLEKLSLQIKSAQEFEKAETLGLLNKKFRDLSVKLKNL